MNPESSLKSEGDRYLVAAIAQGDRDAFRQLVDRFTGRLTAYAAKRLSGSGLAPEDAVQETFLGLLQSLGRLKDVRSLEAYLFRILRNKISDLTGKRPEAHGMHRVPLAGEESREGARGFEPVAPGSTPSSRARHDESLKARDRVLADILDEAIRALKDEKNFRDLKIVELLFYASWRNRDIAAAVEVSEPTVTRVKNATLEKLARMAGRHPLGIQTSDFLDAGDDASHLIRSTWRENLLSCLKRSTLGAYTLGVLEKEWEDYVKFHVETAGCEMCAANLEDLKSGSSPEARKTRERVFQSSVGFLKKN